MGSRRLFKLPPTEYQYCSTREDVSWYHKDPVRTIIDPQNLWYNQNTDKKLLLYNHLSARTVKKFRLYRPTNEMQ